MTTRPSAWRLLVAVVAFVAYLLAGMHLACAGEFASAEGAPSLYAASDDDSGGDHAAGHCHAAHLQVETASTQTPRPGMSAMRVALPPDARHASAERARLEDPPRS